MVAEKKVIEIFVNELESYLKYINEYEVPAEDNKSNEINSNCKVMTIELKLVS